MGGHHIDNDGAKDLTYVDRIHVFYSVFSKFSYNGSNDDGSTIWADLMLFYGSLV